MKSSEMSIKKSTIQQVFKTAQPYLHQEDDHLFVNFFCHVVEGSFCYAIEHKKIESFEGSFDPDIENSKKQFDNAFSKQITSELGVEYIAHSKNNVVKIRCAMGNHSDEPLFCHIDRGNGWKPLTIR